MKFFTLSASQTSLDIYKKELVRFGDVYPAKNIEFGIRMLYQAATKQDVVIADWELDGSQRAERFVAFALSMGIPVPIMVRSRLYNDNELLNQIERLVGPFFKGPLEMDRLALCGVGEGRETQYSNLENDLNEFLKHTSNRSLEARY